MWELIWSLKEKIWSPDKETEVFRIFVEVENLQKNQIRYNLFSFQKVEQNMSKNKKRGRVRIFETRLGRGPCLVSVLF